MDPLAGLDEIDWTAVNHAYGSASDVPDVLRRLASPSITQEDLQSIYYSLYSNIFHQGSRYSASVAAVPFLVALAESPSTVHRDRILRLLVALAVGHPSSLVLSGFDIAGLRAEADKVQADGYAEQRKQERAQYIADAPNEDERKRRERQFIFDDDIERAIEETVIEVRVYDAVKDGLPVFRRLLHDGLASVRALAAYAIGYFPEEIEESQKALLELTQREQEATVRGTALLSLGLLQASVSPPAAEDSPIVEQLSNVFAQTQTGDLSHFCAALCLAMISVAKAEHLEEITRKICDPTYLEAYEPNNLSDENVFPFADPNIVSVASSTLGSVKGSEHPLVPLALATALLSSRGQATLFITGMALRTAFDGTKPAPPGKPTELPPFSTLSGPQQAVIRALTEVNSFNWMFANFLEILRSWGLYTQLKELQAYAGIEVTAETVESWP
ncbi:hypothetical protein C8F01DRAFT_1118571 [Mycena amicta]|nr:hypothetical protein C8F01DRAFT_1118571 [Mycena amicta]